MNSWFVDTSYWIALLNQDDELHERAVALNGSLKGIFFTTHWVLTELLDGCHDRQSREKAVQLIRILEQQNDMIIVQASAASFLNGLELYAKRLDKNWSLTDCMSFLAMMEFDLIEALTADHHFEQAGFVALLKEKQ